MSSFCSFLSTVVKEEFARSHTESPDTTSTEDSNQSPLASPFDPMLWTAVNDLEMDAAPSLRHPSQTLTTRVKPAPSKQSHIIPDSSSTAKSESDSSSVSALFQKGSPVEKQVDPEFVSKVSEAQSVDSPARQERKDKSAGKDSAELDKVSGLIPETGPTSTDLTVDKRADEMTEDSREATNPAQKRAPRLENVVVHSDDSGGKDEQLDTVRSPTVLSETTASEGFKTDEGFSEVSEEASVKEEALPKKIEMQETVAPQKAKSEQEGEIW